MTTPSAGAITDAPAAKSPAPNAAFAAPMAFAGRPIETTKKIPASIATLASDTAAEDVPRSTAVAAGPANAFSAGSTAATGIAARSAGGRCTVGFRHTAIANAAKADATGSLAATAHARSFAGRSGRPVRVASTAAPTVSSAAASSTTPASTTHTPTRPAAMSSDGGVNGAAAAIFAAAVAAAFVATAATSPPNIACFAAKSAVATTNAPPPLTNTVLQYPASPLDWSNQAAA